MSPDLIILVVIALGIIVGGIGNWILATQNERDNRAIAEAKRRMFDKWRIQ